MISKAFFQRTLIFVSGDILNKAIPFLLLPVLTNYLSPYDYGIIATFMVLIPLLGIIVGFGTSSSIFSNYFRMTKVELKIYIGNVFFIVLLSVLLVFIILITFIDLIIIYINFDPYWVYIALLLSVSQLITAVNLRLWIAEERPKIYTFYQLSQTFISVLISLILVIYFDMKWEGYIIGYSISILFYAILSLFLLFKRNYLSFHLRKDYIKDALFFGVPLILHATANWLKNGSDRFILMAILGASLTGIYFISFQFGMVIGIIATAFNKAWTTFLFKRLSLSPSLSEKKKIVLYVYVYFFLMLFGAYIYSEIIQFILPFIVNERFYEAGKYIPYFAIAFAFNGMYMMVTSFIYYEKKTVSLSVLTFLTSLIHVALLFLLINYDGVTGAAKAIFFSYLILFLLSWQLSNKIYPMPWISFIKKEKI